MHKYFFDVTDIMRYIETETTISGIQRVSLEVIKRMVTQYGAEDKKEIFRHVCFLWVLRGGGRDNHNHPAVTSVSMIERIQLCPKHVVFIICNFLDNVN